MAVRAGESRDPGEVMFGKHVTWASGEVCVTGLYRDRVCRVIEAAELAAGDRADIDHESDQVP